MLSGYGAGEKQWLDSAASPGNIQIGQDLDIGTGQEAQLSVSVAAEDIATSTARHRHYKPDADDHLLFKFNGTTVLDIKLADFTDSYGNVDWNKFRDFKVNVTGQAGIDHLTIESTGNNQYTDERRYPRIRWLRGRPRVDEGVEVWCKSLHREFRPRDVRDLRQQRQGRVRWHQPRRLGLDGETGHGIATEH